MASYIVRIVFRLRLGAHHRHSGKQRTAADADEHTYPYCEHSRRARRDCLAALVS